MYIREKGDENRRRRTSLRELFVKQLCVLGEGLLFPSPFLFLCEAKSRLFIELLNKVNDRGYPVSDFLKKYSRNNVINQIQLLTN